MGHSIEVLVASLEPLKAGVAALRHAHEVALAQDLALVPVTDELLEEIASLAEVSGDETYPEFLKLSPSLAIFGRRLSESSPVAYLETDYFGGFGEQAAIVWKGGRIFLGPERTGEGVPLAVGAINKALRALGVVPGGAIDEFDAAGLGRYRSNEDWIEQPRWGLNA